MRKSHEDAPKSAPSRIQVRHLGHILAPSWPTLRHLGTSWREDASQQASKCSPRRAPLGPSWRQEGAQSAPRWLFGINELCKSKVSRVGMNYCPERDKLIQNGTHFLENRALEPSWSTLGASWRQDGPRVAPRPKNNEKC